MIVYKNYVSFSLMGEEFIFFSEELDTGINTVAEVGNRYYYCGSAVVGISTAILLWQKIKGKTLSSEEVCQILKENNLFYE